MKIEKLFYQLQSDQNAGKINIEDEEDLKTRLKHFAITSASKQNSKSNISKEEHAALKSLQRNNSIVIKRPDKGGGVVILDQQDYNDKLKFLIDDQSKFKTCSPKQSHQVKAKINEIAKTYKETHPNTYKNLFIIGEFHPGQLYGLPKIHKNSTNPPLRPIISMTGTVTHALAQYLNKIIQPYINSTYIIRSSDELLVHLSQLRLQPSHQLLSLDVESLFTSVPVEDTISIILQEAYNHPTHPPPDIQRNHLQELLKICTTQTPFNFNGNTFVQSDGVSMGSPLGPTFADFYMSHLENKLLSQNDKKSNPIFYVRYVDDILTVFKTRGHINHFINRLQAGSVLKFTYEPMVDNRFTLSSETNN